MLNQVVLVGRIEVIDDENTSIVLRIPRNVKNEEGIYEDDYIGIELSDKLSKNSIGYLEAGTLVGVKGRIVGVNGKVSIAAEKISFLSTKVKKEEE